MIRKSVHVCMVAVDVSAGAANAAGIQYMIDKCGKCVRIYMCFPSAFNRFDESRARQRQHIPCSPHAFAECEPIQPPDSQALKVIGTHAIRLECPEDMHSPSKSFP